MSKSTNAVKCTIRININISNAKDFWSFNRHQGELQYVRYINTTNDPFHLVNI